jgi:hypothetical protein
MAQKTDLTYLDIKAAASLVKIDAESAYQFVQGEISWQEVLATEIALDPDTLNRYFRDESFSFDEVLSMDLQKNTLESLGLTDSQAIEVEKALTDAVSLADEIHVMLFINRDFSDDYSFGDVAVFAVEKNIAETLSLTELVAMSLSMAKADTFSVLDSAALGIDSAKADTFSLQDGTDLDVTKNLAETVPLSEFVGKQTRLAKADATSLSDAASLSSTLAKSDSFSFSDNFQRVVSFSRTFADSFVLDDEATVDAFTKDTASSKTNAFSFNDTHLFSYAKPLADSVAVSDAQELLLSKSQQDSFGLSESLSRSVTTSNSAVLNTSLLNTFTLNS